MRGFLYVATFATLCVLGTATAITATVPSSTCPGATLISTAQLPAGDVTINYAQFQCSDTTAVVSSGASVTIGLNLNSILCVLLGIDCPPPPPPPPKLPPSPKNECGASCSISCNNNTAGTLPPIASDCQTIVNSFTVFADQLSTFTVEGGHMETLSFGTCNIAFQNFGSETLEYCWSDFGTVATNDGNACFPPNAFSFGAGVCTGYDGLWAVTETHS